MTMCTYYLVDEARDKASIVHLSSKLTTLLSRSDLHGIVHPLFCAVLKYEQHIHDVEMRCFTTLVFSTFGGMSTICNIASLLTRKMCLGSIVAQVLRVLND